MNNQSRNNQSSDKLDRWQHFLELKINHAGNFRNHYETMANVGVTIQIGLFAGILTWHIPYLLSHWVVAFWFVIIWLLIHVFVRWQLRNRRFEAMHYNALDIALQKWANEPLNDLITYTPSKEEACRQWWVFFDLLVLLPCAYRKKFCLSKPVVAWKKAVITNDKNREGYPRELVIDWDKHQNDWFKPIYHAECMYWFGSVIMLALGLFRILKFQAYILTPLLKLFPIERLATL